jgi:hypothetical protein
MPTYNTISAGAIIAKIMRDLKPSNDNFVDDALEWIGEAIEAIGATTSTVKKTVVLKIKDYRHLLPCDLYYINQVNYNPSEDRDNPELNSEFMTIPLRYNSSEFPNNLHATNCINRNANSPEAYYVESDYIKTTFQNGYVYLSYQAFPTDDNGWPLVPKSYAFRQALYWYVIMKMMEGGFEHSNRQINYQTAMLQWEKYCTQAESESKFPDLDRYESFMNQWVRLIPNINRAETNYGHLNTREELDRDSVTQTQIPVSGIFDRNSVKKI